MMRAHWHLAWLAAAALFAPLNLAQAEPGDITFERKTPGTADIPPAVFAHSVHRMRFTCYVCHDAIYKMKAGANSITMDAIQAGKVCGACHNGKIAFQATFDTCTRCHRS
jgi:c(7)-type cytochrome triheme protein